ncbi:MAG: FAD/NAD(P)-binding protein [Halieaceae bacterium]|nr:FAD/NAD(P)-binding protein [Halieaceae bacterium]
MSGPESMLPRTFVVDTRVSETDDVVTLVLRPANGGMPLRCDPGRFNMLYAFAIGEAPISMSGAPGTDGAGVSHTIRDVGAVTRALCSMDAGATVGVRGPFGSPWPLARARGGDVLIVAGGIGLAPVRPLVLEILRDRDAFGRVTLLYGARDPAALIFRRDLEVWSGRGDLDLQVTVDAADERWDGAVGVVPRLLAQARFDPARTTAFVCGPEVMMRFTMQELMALGVPPQRAFLSLERNMVCAIGLCGHCQFGPEFVCADGPVFAYERVAEALRVPEL